MFRRENNFEKVKNEILNEIYPISGLEKMFKFGMVYTIIQLEEIFKRFKDNDEVKIKELRKLFTDSIENDESLKKLYIKLNEK